MGDTSGHRRRLHPRSRDGRERLLRRISDQRAGRGCRRRHPHAAISDQGGARDGRGQAAVDGRGDARGLCRAGATCSNCSKRHYRDMQDIEFTVERGKLWMLQTRSGKRTAKAALKIAVDMAAEGLITQEEAVCRGRSDGARPVAAPDARSRCAARCADQGAASLAGRGLGHRSCSMPTPPNGATIWAKRDPRPRRNQPRRHSRHARGQGHPDRARRHDAATPPWWRAAWGVPAFRAQAASRSTATPKCCACRWRELKEGDILTSTAPRAR